MAQNPPRICQIEPFVSEVTPQPGSLEEAASSNEIFQQQIEAYLNRLSEALCADLQEVVSEITPAYGEIFADNNAVPTVISAPNTLVQVAMFSQNGQSVNAGPDFNENHIVVERAGDYLILVSASVLSGSGAGAVFHASVGLNNGAEQLADVEWHRELSGGGGDVGSTSMSGLHTLAVGDTVELWVENQTNATDIIFQDATLTIVKVDL